MRTDLDLQFLQNASNDDLRNLCDILTRDKNGRIRMSEQLLSSDEYLQCYPDNMHGMWQDLAVELQRYGGNTILNLFRDGRGPAYENVVYDVCKFVHVPGIGKHDTAAEMELKLLFYFTEQMLNGMSPEQLEDLVQSVDIREKSLDKQLSAALIMVLIRTNQRLLLDVLLYISRLVATQLVGRGIFVAGMNVAGRAIGVLAGPIGWALLTGWTLWDITGPAYRVTVPAVLQVACMRLKSNYTHILEEGGTDEH